MMIKKPDSRDDSKKPIPDSLCSVYILRCSDGTLYTGKANNIESRLRVHNAGRGAKYTRSRLPVELVYSERFDSNREAAQREYQIKKLSKAQKENLIIREQED